MKTWITELQAVDPESGDLCFFPGPRIHAETWEGAEELLKMKGLTYCRVVGEFQYEFELHYN